MSPHHLLILLLHEGVDDTGMDLGQPGHSPSPGHPEGGISGQSGILERILLSCLKGLLVVRLEPVDVDFGPPWGCR